MRRKNKSICVVYGGDSLERGVSIKSAKSIYKAIKDDYIVTMFDFKGDYDVLYKNIKSSDLVFNALHGGDGEDGTLQKYFESKHIKYTGSYSKASKIAMNKHQSKLLCLKNNIQTPKWLCLNAKNFDFHNNKIHQHNDIRKFILHLIKNNSGLVVKPNNEGSSFGITIVKNIGSNIDVFFNQNKLVSDAVFEGIEKSKEIIFEEYVIGRELTVGILNNKVLPIVEILPTNQYYDYTCKYTKGKSEYVVPAKINDDIRSVIEKKALKIYKKIGCSSYARVDFILNNTGNIFFLEVNTLPGFTDTSLFPKAATASGLSYKELINKIIDNVSL